MTNNNILTPEDLDDFETFGNEYDSARDSYYRYWGVPKCECGADKAGIPWHSDYCPKYEEKT